MCLIYFPQSYSCKSTEIISSANTVNKANIKEPHNGTTHANI